MTDSSVIQLHASDESAPSCGLYIVLRETDDHDKQNFQLGQALHAANRFSSYETNRHAVEFRFPPASSDDTKKIISAYRDTCARNGFVFLVADDAALARDIGADGVVCSTLAKATQARGILGEDSIIGVRCATLEQVKAAKDIELDFVSLYSSAEGDPLLKMLGWWTTSSDNPVSVEGLFDPETCASIVQAGATFIQSDHHIWTHPSGNIMQGVVNMLDAFERHKKPVRAPH